MTKQRDGDTMDFEESKHPRADDGKFTNGSGSHTKLPHSDLDKALSALDEVDRKRYEQKGITLTPQEHGVLRAEVMRKNAAHKGKVKPVNFAFTANHFYVYSTKGHDDFTILEQLNIEKNRTEIDSFLKQLRENNK